MDIPTIPLITARVQLPTLSPESRVRVLRSQIADAEAELVQLRADLAAALVEAGRRPGDGSDQPALFEVDNPKLF